MMPPPWHPYIVIDAHTNAMVAHLAMSVALFAYIPCTSKCRSPGFIFPLLVWETGAFE